VISQCCSGAFTVETGVVVQIRPDGSFGRIFRLPQPELLPTDGDVYYRPGAVMTADGGVRAPAFVVGGAVSLTGITASGQPDTALGPTGTRIIPGLGEVFEMLRDGSNRLYFVGRDAAGELTVVRTGLDGTIDPSYGSGGTVTVPIKPQAVVAPGPRLRAVDAEVTRMGTLYATVTADHAGRPTATVVRVTSGGVVDPGFGTGGVATFSRPGASTSVNAIGFATGGRLVLGITAVSVSSPTQVTEYLVRAAAVTGAPDPTFGRAGWYHTVERNTYTMVDSSGRLVIAAIRPTGVLMPGSFGPGFGIVVRRLS
jgi:hypothetical protein